MKRRKAQHTASTLKQKRRTAIHEAGHAVIGRVLRQTCGQATITSNFEEREAGHSICADPHRTYYDWDMAGRFRGDQMRSIMRGRIMSFMAGAEAEREFFGRRAVGDGDDRYQIDLMLDELVERDEPNSMKRLEERLRRFTRGLVHRHRQQIERVANLLLKRETLTPKEIAAATGLAPLQPTAGMLALSGARST